MMNALKIIIGFIHDLATGCWLATVLVVYLLERNTSQEARLVPVIQQIQKEFFYIGILCVAVVLVTGAGRTFTYINNVYGKDLERLRRRMLVVKHIVLFFVFGAGMYWSYRMAFF